MQPAEVLSPRRQIAHQLAKFYGELAEVEGKPAPQFSVARVIREMAAGGLRSGYEAEVAQGAALAANRAYDSNRVLIPWSALARRDFTMSGSGGNYLVNTVTGPVADALRPWSISVSAGLTIFENLHDNLTCPRVDADAVGYWLPTEADSASESNPTLGQVSMSPKTWCGVTEFSHQFARQAQPAEAFIRAQLLRVAGRAIDAAILGGTGQDGQPLGVVNVPGIPSISGASLDWSDVLTMRETVGDANDTRLSWIAGPDVRKLLAGREIVSTSGRMIWADNQIDGRPAYTTADAPDATLFLADFATVALGIWGPGLQVEINPMQDFTRGIIGARVLLDVDVVVLQKAAVCVATSVS